MKDTIKKNQIPDIFKKSANSGEYLENYAHYLGELISCLDKKEVQKVIDCFSRARERDASIFFAGNGGSAATASHFAQDLSEVGKKTGTKNFRAFSLTDNIPVLTALGNDYGFESIFSEQLKKVFRKRDILVVISASGNSPNVVEAVRLAKRLKGTTIGLVGFDGGELMSLCDRVIHVETRKGDYGPVEDVHLVLDHIITSYLMYLIASSGKA